LLQFQQLRERDLSERVVDDLVHLNDHRTNAAVAGVYARIEDTRIALAVRLGGLAFENRITWFKRISDAGRWSV
jgi:hypothetical protein